MRWPKEFEYEEATKNRLEMPHHVIGRRCYSLLVSNGFVKLYTTRGRAYWVAQTDQEHKTPDWKLHIGIADPSDLPTAWNIIARHFTSTQNPLAMKCVNFAAGGADEEQQHKAAESWKKQGQAGREITVYMFSWHESLAEGVPYVRSDSRRAVMKLPKEELSQPAEYWYDFIESVEKQLQQAQIKPPGCAVGDLQVGRRGYVSLRNEAFCWDTQKKEMVYPPNKAGWNAAKQWSSMPIPLVTAMCLHFCCFLPLWLSSPILNLLLFPHSRRQSRWNTVAVWSGVVAAVLSILVLFVLPLFHAPSHTN